MTTIAPKSNGWGLIAGNGRFPFLVLEGARSQGIDMLAEGWLNEVRRLMAGGLSDNAKPFDFIGYRELRSHLRGELTFEQARAAIQQGTRQYAKRQLTWFRREANVHWLSGFGDAPDVQSMAQKWLQQAFSQEP